MIMNNESLSMCIPRVKYIVYKDQGPYTQSIYHHAEIATFFCKLLMLRNYQKTTKVWVGALKLTSIVIYVKRFVLFLELNINVLWLYGPTCL